MTELNYDLIPEELKRKAIDYCVKASETFNLQNAYTVHSGESIQIGDEILASQQIKKPVDISVLVDSGVLCEFSSGAGFAHPTMGFLDDMGYKLYRREEFYEYRYCRPLFGHWHSAKNFDDVEGLIAKLKDAGFEVEVEVEVEYLKINLFRITGMQCDYCMPWEV